VTFPAAVPVAAAAVQVSTAGVLTFSNTFTENLTSTDFRYTSVQTLLVPGVMADTADRATITFGAVGSSSAWSIITSTSFLIYPVQLRMGDTIKAWRLYVDNASVAGTITARLYRSVSRNALRWCRLGDRAWHCINIYRRWRWRVRACQQQPHDHADPRHT
jgi:hypothetical protein